MNNISLKKFLLYLGTSTEIFHLEKPSPTRIHCTGKETANSKLGWEQKCINPPYSHGSLFATTQDTFVKICITIKNKFNYTIHKHETLNAFRAKCTKSRDLQVFAHKYLT